MWWSSNQSLGAGTTFPIYFFTFLTPCATLEVNPWQCEQAMPNPCASMPNPAPASSGMLLV